MTLLTFADSDRGARTDHWNVKAHVELTRLIERLHRRFLEVLRAGLAENGVAEVSPVQALLLVNIGHDECSARDLTERGYYMGSNAAYNVNRLVAAGYLARSRSPHDRRAVRIRLTDKGLALYETVLEIQARLADRFAAAVENDAEAVEASIRVLARLDRLWAERVQERTL